MHVLLYIIVTGHNIINCKVHSHVLSIANYDSVSVPSIVTVLSREKAHKNK